MSGYPGQCDDSINHKSSLYTHTKQDVKGMAHLAVPLCVCRQFLSLFFSLVVGWNIFFDDRIPPLLYVSIDLFGSLFVCVNQPFHVSPLFPNRNGGESDSRFDRLCFQFPLFTDQQRPAHHFPRVRHSQQVISDCF